MTAIESLAQIGDQTELKRLVRDYLEHEIHLLHEASGILVSLEDLLEHTFDDIESYLPPDGRILIARLDDGAPVGCAFLRMIRSDASEVKRLYVSPEARGSGLGRDLMEQVIRHSSEMNAARILLDTGVYDTAAHGLYAKLGFRDIGYYPESEFDSSFSDYVRYMQLDL